MPQAPQQSLPQARGHGHQERDCQQPGPWREERQNSITWAGDEGQDPKHSKTLGSSLLSEILAYSLLPLGLAEAAPATSDTPPLLLHIALRHRPFRSQPGYHFFQAALSDHRQTGTDALPFSLSAPCISRPPCCLCHSGREELVGFSVSLSRLQTPQGQSGMWSACHSP